MKEEESLLQYFERHIPYAGDPLDAVSTLTAATENSEFVVYERKGIWHFARDPFFHLRVDSKEVHVTLGDDYRALSWKGQPWATIHRVLHDLVIPQWSAYGWIAFEVAGGHQPVAAETLAEIIVPSVEVRVSHGSLLLRALSEEKLEQLAASVQKIVPSVRTIPSPVDVETTDVTYMERVAEAVQRIRNGELKKVILSRCVSIPFAVDIGSTYNLGRRSNTPARSFLLQLGGWQAAGFSPERIVEVDDRTASTQPLAGTRALTGDEAHDSFLATELLGDPKEIYEHATSVKLAFEELSQVGKDGTTRVSDFMSVQPRGSVQHIASQVDTELDPSKSAWDALGAVFPAVTATGISKEQAFRVIGALEPEPRGLYGGAVLMASADGSLDAALVLRAVYQKNGKAWLRAGAGVIGLSHPEREHEETCEKLRSVAPYVVAEEGDSI